MREAIIILFLAMNVVIALFSQFGKRKIKTEEDMNLGSRKFGWFTSGASAAASGCSAYAFIGMAGAAYTVGVSMIWYSALATIWSWGVFYLMGKRLRRLSVKTGTTTVVDYLSARFEDKMGVFRLISALVIVGFMTAYVTSNFQAIGKAFLSFLGWKMAVGILIGAVVVAFYTALAGFRANTWLNTIQGVIMLIGSGVLLIFILVRAGGLTALLTQAAAIEPNLITVTGGKAGWVFAAFLIGWVGSGMMGLGNPHVAVRPMGQKDDAGMKQAGIWSYVINVWVMYMGVFSGLAARVWLGNLNDVDLAYGMIVGEIMAPVLGALVIAGILSATMSTVSAQLLVAATEISTNIFRRIKKQFDESFRINITRVCVIVLALISIYFSFNSGEIVFYLILFAWAGLGCSFGPILLLSLYWKRMTWAGALAGMVAGAVAVVVWKQTPALSKLIYEGFPGMVISFIAIFVVSYLTRPPESADEMIEFSKRNAA